MAAATSQAASLAVPLTQNTAPVLEFQCLFTSDIRRKQKRWQDGRLKFHAFNKRVRVFDDRGCNVGDTHFQQDYEFEEGEELELDRGGVLVQVGQCVARGEQDLSELLDKRAQEKEKRREARAAAVAGIDSPFRTLAHPNVSSFSAASPAIASFQARPKSLNQLLGTPSGHHGRALLPTKSPFEERRLNLQLTEKENLEERPAKRRKPEPAPSRAGYAQSLTGATLNLSRPASTPASSRPIIRHRYAPSIDLTSDDAPAVATIPQAHSHAELESSGIRITKAQRKDRVERSKPEKSGYAENLTGVALTLSGTFGKPRQSGAERPRYNLEAPRPKIAQTLQRPVQSEAVENLQSKRVNPFLRDDDGFVEVGAVDVSMPTTRWDRDLTREDEEPEEIERTRARVKSTKRAKTGADNTSQKAPNKRQKASEPKSKPKATKKSSAAAPRPRPPSPVAREEAPEISDVPHVDDNNTTEQAKESGKVNVVLLRPLRIKARPPRKMLISAGRSVSHSSVDVPTAEATRSRSTPNGEAPGNDLSVAARNNETRNPVQDVNLEPDDDFWQSPPVFNHHHSLQEKSKLANNTNVPEPFETPRQGPHRAAMQAVNSVTPVVRQPRAAREPSSSPEFEGLDYQAIDSILSRNGNASPFAPQALRQAISQAKSPLALSRKKEHSPTAQLGSAALTASANLTELPQMKCSSHGSTVSRERRSPGATNTHPKIKQSESQQLNNFTPSENQVLPQNIIRASPVIKESSSALVEPTPPKILQPEIVPAKPAERQIIPNPPTLKSATIQEVNTEIPHQSETVLGNQRLATASEAPAQINRPQPPPRKAVIPNPATRGKKAAQKTDAAGKAPILGPVFPHPAPVPMAPPPGPVPRPRVNRVPSRVQSAGSVGSGVDLAAEAEGKGPWGKEAFDLFDWRPPTMRAANDATA